MNTVYGIIKQEYILHNYSRISYGIAVYANSEEEGTACVIYSVLDICNNYDKIKKFVNICNTFELSILHLDDAITDFLNS